MKPNRLRRVQKEISARAVSSQLSFHRCSSSGDAATVSQPLGKLQDPRKTRQKHQIKDDFVNLREHYEVPKHPIVLAHGLFGFDELHIAGSRLPGIQYWRGITEALGTRGVEVVTADVPASSSIEDRAAKLAKIIKDQVGGKGVNIIAGLDSRYMISHLQPSEFKVHSLTTIATPHRGSAFADYVLNQIGPIQLPKLYRALEFFGLETGAFSQLTRDYMEHTFNPRTPDAEDVKYYSYGAAFAPFWWSMFWQSQHILQRAEGDNDGLVSVRSSKWGQYQGTLAGVSHLDLINWTNRLRWFVWELSGNERNFNCIAFYLSIADMLAKEGL